MNIMPVDEAYEKILCCAMRYALGRRTHIVYEVADYIKKVLLAVSSMARLDTLMIMQQDIENQHGFGDELDEKRWMMLYVDILNEIKKKYACEMRE